MTVNSTNCTLPESPENPWNDSVQQNSCGSTSEPGKSCMFPYKWLVFIVEYVYTKCSSSEKV
jgi:hypothetical protein